MSWTRAPPWKSTYGKPSRRSTWVIDLSFRLIERPGRGDLKRMTGLNTIDKRSASFWREDYGMYDFAFGSGVPASLILSEGGVESLVVKY